MSPLHHALNKNNTDFAAFILSCGATASDSDEEGVTPLHTACHLKVTNIIKVKKVELFNFNDVSKLILATGANVNATTTEGQTPLHYAAKVRALEVIKLLFENKVNLNELFCF